MSPSVLLLELNELCPPLLERFIADGDLPAFERLRAESTVFVTDAEEPQANLNPWIQWVTVHSGVGYDRHGIFKLGEGAALTAPTVADVVGRGGGSVWLCGPMNVVPVDPVRGRWLPDPWNPDESYVDPELRSFARFVRANVQEHTNSARRLSAVEHLRFLGFMLRHGISGATVRATGSQLAGEVIRRRHRWRRAALLDRFQWDLFAHLYRRERPTFATYFSNTTAHYQHLYWRHMEPEAFTLRPDEDELERFGDAVRFGYREMDRIVARAMALAGPDTTLVLCTALSQQPYTLKDDEGGNRFHRPRDIERLATELGLHGVTQVAPVMAAQFHLYFASDEDAAVAEGALRGAKLAGRSAFDVRRVGTDVFCGCCWTTDVPVGALLEVPATGARLPFHERFYRSETAKSGYHHPEGALWIRTPRRRGERIDEPVPLQAVAPTLLQLLDLPIPTSMAAAPLTMDRVDHPAR